MGFNAVSIPPGFNPQDLASLYGNQPQMPVTGAAGGIPNFMPQGNYPQINVPVVPVDRMQSMNYMPQTMPQQSQQMSPQVQHISDVLNEYVNSKTQQQSGNGTTEQILAQRFHPDQAAQQPMSQPIQPNMQDISTAGLREAQSYAQKQGGFAVDPNQIMAQRYADQFAPYTSMLSPQIAQAKLQGEQINDQYLPQTLQAKIDLDKAQAQMATGGGLFGSSGGMAPNGQQIGSAGGGDEFLKTLSPSAANMVKGIAEGRMPLPSGFVLKTPFGQQLIAAVNKYDPSFDFVNSGARMNTRKSFTSGPDAGNIAALNTAIAHLGTLQNSFNKLGNTDYPSVNTVKNYLGNELNLGDIQANTSNVGTDATAVSHELAKVFRSIGMSEGEIKEWESRINVNASPKQMNSVIGSALDLMEGRMQALAEKYNQGMGTTKQPLELLSSQAQQSYNSLRGTGPAQTGASVPGSTNKVINFGDLPP